MDIKSIVKELCAYGDEQEWFEFKENWFQPDTLGEYVSAMSNAAAFHNRKYAFFVWGINNDTHEIIGTTFNQYCEYNKEPYQNYRVCCNYDTARVIKRFIFEKDPIITISNEGQLYSISFSSIIIIRVSGNYIQVKTDTRTYRSRKTLKHFIAENDLMRYFIRINQSELINPWESDRMSHIKYIWGKQ